MRKGRLRAGPCSGPDPGTPPRHSLTASQALSLKRSGWAEGQADFPTTKSVCVRVCERETERIHLDLENINTHGLYQWGLMKITLSLGMRSLVAQTVKNLPSVQETQVQSRHQEDCLEKGMAAHSSVPAWRVPWTEEPDGPHGVAKNWTWPSD